MSFYVRKQLAPGPIRFGVSPRNTISGIDDDAALSTAAAGEFQRRRLRGFFFAETRPIGQLTMPSPPSITGTPFVRSMFDGSARGWGFMAMMAIGTLFLLLALALIGQDKPVAIWLIPTILGVILIGIPIFITAQARGAIKAREDQERAAREEETRRYQEILSSYSAALEELRKDPSPANMTAAGRERDKLDLSYRIWSPLARSSVLHIGFNALAEHGSANAPAVNDIMLRASAAVGLNPADELRVKLDLFRVVLWHLLADDRHGAPQAAELKKLRDGLGIEESDVPVETKALQEFDALRGLTHKNLPRLECGTPLGVQEYCVHTTRGSLLKQVRQKIDGVPVPRLVPAETCSIFVTNKRVIVDSKKRQDVPMTKIDDVEVDVDAEVLTIRPARGYGQVFLQVEDLIYSAALIDIATSLDERPKGFH